jgi:hypothetical protein
VARVLVREPEPADVAVLKKVCDSQSAWLEAQ